MDGEVLCGIAAKQLRGRKPESVAVNSKGRIGALELNDFCIEDDGRTKKVSVEKVHTQFYKYMKSKWPFLHNIYLISLDYVYTNIDALPNRILEKI